ncbi:putative bifunctional diguanylate cyclase/phosphodiesterase [Chthonobacter albigriseus]|uniref:putative bifunctional diguanylate cyclase/phosphodiesterase n=1 Tax=Chthonobacter albigriseus TaxID=1683161 RepID=UPI0015EE6E40|nr:EAL domain-containing protein [Chthonobacter albigriseus]
MSGDREAERLAELRASRILDSAASPEFEAVVAHACAIFDVPHAYIALIDESRVWMKAACGFPRAEHTREDAFCSRTIGGDDLVVVEDIATDPEFARISGRLSLDTRFYAGAPLVVRPGVAIGSLCLLDSKPRRFTPAQRTALKHLASVVTGLIRGHRLAQEAIELAQEADAQRFVLDEHRRELELRERRFRQTETMARVGGWELSLVTGGVTWSDEVYRIYDLEIGTPVDSEAFLAIYPGAERYRFEEILERSVRDGNGFDAEFEVLTAAGNRRWIRCVGDIEIHEGEAHRLFGSIQDVSERHRVEARLWQVANTDALTGLANRHRFESELADCFNGLEPTGIGLMMIDVDHLKEVNDTLGHTAGDELIRTVADRIQALVSGIGFVARLGGDEFAVIVNEPGGQEGLAALAESILAAMQPSFRCLGHTITPKVSIGGSIAQPGSTPETLRQEADLGLYHAKEIRRGIYVAFREDLRTAITRRVHTLKSVEAGLSEGRVVAWYQPVISLSTGRIVGVESLARMEMPDGSVKSAAQFASAFEDARVAAKLTTRMLQRVFDDLATFDASEIDVPHVGINVGMHDFRAGHLAERILAACDEAAVPVSRLILEVTEHVFLSRGADAVSRTVAQLRDRGMTVALDDFGTGYASLAHLGTFPVDLIKMDKSFVKRMIGDGPGAVISAALVELAHRLGIRVIAEGIETAGQLDRLCELGCEMGQGYFFARPMAVPDLLRFMETFRPRPGRAGPVLLAARA